MTRRSGATLLEVLVAIFVMGIGMLALLTLFPLGALRMAKAIQDQRCAEAAANASSVWTMKSIYNDAGLSNPSDAFLNPGNGNNAIPDGPSYPVFVDPLGWMSAQGTPSQANLAGGSYIARRTVDFVGKAALQRQAGYQWFTLLDDIDFENAVGAGPTTSVPGTPRWIVTPPPAKFSRDIRYSYGFLCQRPRYADSTVVDISVVVYNKRSVAMTPGLSLPEYPYSLNTSYNTINNTITIDYTGNVPPPVRAGDWVLDGTPVGVNNSVVTNANPAVSAHGYFYRIVGVNDVGPNLTELEVETPLRGFPANTANNPGMAIVLDGVAEVFTKGTARLP